MRSCWLTVGVPPAQVLPAHVMHTNRSESALTWMSWCWDMRQRLNESRYSAWQRFSFSQFSFFFCFKEATDARKQMFQSLAALLCVGSVTRGGCERSSGSAQGAKVFAFMHLCRNSDWVHFLPLVFALILFSRTDSRIFIRLHLSPSVMRFCLTLRCKCWSIIFISWSYGTPGERWKNVKNVGFFEKSKQKIEKSKQ